VALGKAIDGGERAKAEWLLFAGRVEHPQQGGKERDAGKPAKPTCWESSLTRAVIFSADTTATAFGSLWLSSHPGTSSMGKLLTLTLACTMLAAVVFQPLLMGPPREIKKGRA
jgi:hypothetical protein